MPANNEDREGKCFVGAAGGFLDSFIQSYLKKDYTWEVTNAFRCFKGKKPNRELVKPTAEEFRACRRHLEREIEELKPKWVVAMGQYAVAQVLGVPINSVKMNPIISMPLTTPWQGTQLFPMNHPAAMLRLGVDRWGGGPGVEKWERQWEHLMDAVKGIRKVLPGTWDWIDEYEEQEAFYEGLLDCEEVAYDYETTGLDVYADSFRMVGYAWGPEEATVCSLKEPWARELHFDFLRRYQGPTDLHNCGMELLWGGIHGGAFPQYFTDTKVLSFLIEEEQSHRLEDLIDRYLPELSGYKRKTEAIGIQFASDEVLAERCAFDCMATWSLAQDLWGRLTEAQQDFYREIVEPGLRSVVNCRIRGWKADQKKMVEILELCDDRLTDLYAQSLTLPGVAAFEDSLTPLHKRTGKKRKKVPLNLNSNKHLPQLMKYLDIDDGLDRQDNDPELMRTAGEVLEKRQDLHPVMPLAIEYKQLKRVKGAFYSPLYEGSLRDGFFHPNYNWGGKPSDDEPGGTRTGRLSASRIMMLPRNKGDGHPLMRKVRECFTTRWEGGTILGADYAQLELRIMAMLAQEGELLKVFERGEDFHQLMADRVGCTRDEAKTLIYAILYGIGKEALARQLGKTVAEVEVFMADFREANPDLQRFFGRVKERAIVDGYIEGPWGMRVHCLDAQSQNDATVSHAMRRVGNWPIQHIGGIFCFEAMGSADPYLMERGSETCLFAQWHDALYADVHPDDDIEEVQEILTKAMLDDLYAKYEWLTVPLEIDFKAGRTMAG
jgi:DNA polymerase-1